MIIYGSRSRPWLIVWHTCGRRHLSYGETSHVALKRGTSSRSRCLDQFRPKETCYCSVFVTNLAKIVVGETKSNMKLCSIVSILVVGCTMSIQSDGKILAECDAVRELQRGRISRSLIGNWVCLMENESGLNTQLITGPKTASSYSYGVFQINSAKWCSRGHAGGVCNKRCEDFADDDIQDDIACAKKIYNQEGFKAWSGWLKNCKNKPLLNIGICSGKRR